VRAPKGIAAEVWQGNRKVLNVKPMHCLGLTPAQVVEMMAEILKACSTELNVEMSRFAWRKEHQQRPCTPTDQKLSVIIQRLSPAGDG
jgi:hypothetical protein